MNSKGNGRYSYELTDATAFNGTSTSIIYRVKQVDKDGSASYSPSVLVKAPIGHPLLAIPNPFVNNLHVTVPSKQVATIHDVTGKTVAKHQLYQGYNVLNLEDLMPGTYVIRTEDNQSLRLVKQ